MDIKTWLSQQSHAATSVFHLGRYCEQWKASSYETGNASFHVVLEGECWLSLGEKQGDTALSEGDIVFFFSCIPFSLQSSPSFSPEALPEKAMLPFGDAVTNETALLCGFLHPKNPQSELLFAMMPEYLLIRPEMRGSARIRTLLELLKLECLHSGTDSELAITRLTDLLLVYVIEEVMAEHLVDVNLLLASRQKEFAALFLDIVRNPHEEWSIEYMAERLQMSRSTFIRKIQSISGYSPNELVMRLRVNVAVNLLRRGHTVDIVAPRVGYESLPGFYKAFKKITASTPAECARMFSVADQNRAYQ
ncbi:cupin domain-containing protein [Citrobacter sp. VF227]